MKFVYPASDLDRYRNMLATLGSFWARTYTGTDQLRSYVNATAEVVAQSHLNVLELAASLSRFSIPVFHTENWLPIPLRRSNLKQGANSTTAFRFDRTPNTFDMREKQFNVPIETDAFLYAVSPKLKSVYQIFDRLIFPTVTFSQNCDFVIDEENNALVFAQDPFENKAFLRRGIYNESGALVDEEIMLWGFKAKLDYKYVFEQFSYSLNLHLASSENAKNFTNAVYSALLNGGTTVTNFTDALSAICGAPVAKTDGEVVELITIDAQGLFIATDKNVYRFAAAATPVVTVGQKLRTGDILIQAFEIVEFTQGDVPASISALALDQGFVSSCFYGDLIFENKDVPLEVNTNHPTGYTFVRFSVSGFPVDVDLFFDELHQRGIEAAQYAQDPCFEKPIKHATKDQFPVTGSPDSVYMAEDTGHFYKWQLTNPAQLEFGYYAELTTFERCHPPWEQFDKFEVFPTRGNVNKIYLAADTKKFYRWVVQTPSYPAQGAYVYVPRPYPLSKLGTLAHLLDKREQPDGEPTADDLPKKINPLGFLVKNVFRNNVFVVLIRVSALGKNRLGLYNIRHLRQVLPPNVAAFFVYELDTITDRKNGADDLSDDISRFTGMEPLQDAVPEVYVHDRGVTVSTISGTCQ